MIVKFTEATLQEKCNFLNIVQKAFAPPPPIRLNIRLKFRQSIWDISRLKHPFYALVCAAKGPLYYTKFTT